MDKLIAQLKTRRCLAVLACASGVLVLAASGASAATKTGEAKRATLELTVAVPLVDTPFAVVYAAQALQYYKQAGVKVNVQFVGANTIASLVAGQADVAMFGTGQSFLPVVQGKPTTVIYNFLANGNGASLAVRSDSPYTSVQQLSGKRIGVLGVGGSSYGFGQIYSHYVATHGGQAFTIISQPSITALVDGVVSGQLDGVVGSGSWFAGAMEQGKAKLLLDSTKSAFVKPLLIGDVAEASIFGLTDKLKAKREAVTRFLTAVVKAQRWMSKNPAKVIAAKINPVGGFALIPLHTLIVSGLYNKHFWTPTEGVITPALWQSTLTNIATWNLPGIDVANPQFSFSQRVDMSYLAAARKRAGAAGK
jgi:ABC-type nitrate/sulfonate/bicarbonate transport system substrate-binding protein